MLLAKAFGLFFFGMLSKSPLRSAGKVGNLAKVRKWDRNAFLKQHLADRISLIKMKQGKPFLMESERAVQGDLTYPRAWLSQENAKRNKLGCLFFVVHLKEARSAWQVCVRVCLRACLCVLRSGNLSPKSPTTVISIIVGKVTQCVDSKCVSVGLHH